MSVSSLVVISFILFLCFYGLKGPQGFREYPFIIKFLMYLWLAFFTLLFLYVLFTNGVDWKNI